MSALRIKTADSEKKACEPAPLVLTIGHSTFTLKEFISLLHAHGATCVVDVRTVPRSRHSPPVAVASGNGRPVTRASNLKQQLKGKLIEHKEYIGIHGEDRLGVRNCKWPNTMSDHHADFSRALEKKLRKQKTEIQPSPARI